MDYQLTIAQAQLPKWMRTNVIIRNKAVPVVHFSSPVVHSTWQCHLGMAMEIFPSQAHWNIINCLKNFRQQTH